MARRAPRDLLHIGFDADKAVIAPDRLRMRSGRAVRRRYGTTVEVLPLPASGRTRDDRIRFAAQIAVPIIILCAVLDALGIAWWMPAAGAVLLVGFFVLEQARAARPGVLAVPAGEDVHVLEVREERDAFERAVGVARRIRRTWPALGELIDPADADRALTRALAELAALLARRQQLRRLRAELSEVRHRDLAPDSPAVQALAAQRDRVERLWRATGESANRMLGSINTTAVAGESLLYEQRSHETARDAGLAISRLAAAGPAPDVEAGPELAERTAAVIAAYRELTAGLSG